MGIFFPSKRLMPSEFENRFRSRLASAGLSSRKVDQFSDMANAALYEQGSHRGIDRREKEQLIHMLRERRFQNGFTEKDIDRIEKAFENEV
ncbi:MAG: hypothetical protein WDN67_02940 [Candidatus Moraniibacteriota bacterium]